MVYHSIPNIVPCAIFINYVYAININIFIYVYMDKLQ